MKENYAVQHKESGQLVFTCETIEQAKPMLDHCPALELVDITHSSKLSVQYTELGGPWGYGHQEISFETYGGLKKCIERFYTWAKSTASVFGPDARDIRDYFRHCSLYINGVDKTSWLLKQIDSLSIKTIFIIK